MATPVPLGMPPMPPAASAPAWRTAWDTALYGPDGFFRREPPAAHFRTSVHASALFASALVRLAHDAGLDTVVDVGAGRGELLQQVHGLDPSLRLLGVEVAGRPAGLPPAIAWTSRLPRSVAGLVVANEWLDNVPCHVVAVDEAGTPRVVHVDPGTGEETLGAALADPKVPRNMDAWCRSWWPLAEPGTRAEVGTTRDAAWAGVVRRVRRGIALAIDFGHTLADRPAYGSLRSYRAGSQVDVLADGSRDVTADVAVDAVAAAAQGRLVRQADALGALGVSSIRPGPALATADPQRYLRGLRVAGEAAELTAADGLGAFWWVLSAVGIPDVLAAPGS